jgi:hypothetical protein
LSSLPVGAPSDPRVAASRDSYLARTGPSTVYFVPLAPAICVELGAVADGAIAIGDVTDEVGELAVWPAFVAWVHPAPISATAAVAADKTAVRFVIECISFLSNRAGPAPTAVSPTVSPNVGVAPRARSRRGTGHQPPARPAALGEYAPPNDSNSGYFCRQLVLG